MASLLMLRLCLLSVTLTATGLQPSVHPLMFASFGDRVILPCGVPAITSCSSVNWIRSQNVTEVVKSGQVTGPFVPRFDLLHDCSLQIHHLKHNDAQLYFCESGALSSSVDLRILQITEKLAPEAGTLQLDCFLNSIQGYNACKDRGMNITWTTGDYTPLKGDRFTYKHHSECFSKLIISKKLTDHHRKWRCQLSQNGTVKANASYTTTVKDGLEEVFAVVGESVSFPCGDTSSLGVGSRVKWGMGSQTLMGDMSPDEEQTKAFHVTTDSSLTIIKVSPVHAGEYQCSVSTGHPLNKFRLHTLDVTSESSSGGENITLTCVLTCSTECEEDFELTWTGGGSKSTQSSLIRTNNTLIRSLFVPSLSMASNELVCSVHREGELMASKIWQATNNLQTPVWLVLSLGLSLVLVCISAAGLYTYIKRKQNKDAENELTSIGMTHVYEGIEEDSYEEQHPRRNPRKEAATTTDSFYDLLQAVN
ncbi:uncharacterized protein LOC117822273 isoform X7 [Xyrichtys novacula]|nr:uncharacterized protein LOC117822273 isoform X7 [Xyrichtys novacula]